MSRRREPPASTLVVGNGRVGQALALAQARYGDRVWLLGRRRGPWMAWARRQGVEPLLALSAEAQNASRVLLCVPDEALAGAAADLARRMTPRRDRFAAHVSGRLGLAPLRPFARRGAAVAALHPVLPFGEPLQVLMELQGGLVTVLPGPRARRPALALLARWGARPLLLRPGVDRVRYHLGLVLAANHLTGLLAWSEELVRPALGREARGAVGALAAAALQRLREAGPEAALTGPVVRGDIATVRAHLARLSPAERARYRGLLELVIRLAQRSGRLDARRAAALRRLR